MPYKYHDDVILLSEGQAISKVRLWGLRILLVVLFIPQFANPPASITGWMGTIFGFFILYYVGLYILKSDTDKLEIGPSIDVLTPDKVVGYTEINGVVTAKELRREIDLSNSDFDDPDDWWETDGKPALESAKSVEKMDPKGRRWREVSDNQ